MYDHIKSLKRVGGTDIPVGDSIESEDARKARAAALAADKPVATVRVTDTEAVKEAIKVHVTGGAGGARIAGFGPTSTSSTSGVHSHPDAFHRRKGVVNTMGGARDVSRADSAAKLPPKGPGGAMPGARVAGLSSLDPHAEEGKAKRAAAEAKMRSHSSGPAAGGLGGGGGGGGANISGFSKNMGVTRIAGPAKRTGGGGGATVAAALAAAGKGPAPGASESHAPAATHRPLTLGSLGGHGRVGGSGVAGGASGGSTAASGSGLPPRSGSAATTRSDPGSGSGSASAGGAAAAAAEHDGGAAAGGAGAPAGSDAARRAAFFRKQMADKAAATAAAVEMLKGPDA